MTFEEQLRQTVREAVTDAVAELVMPREWLTPEQVGDLLGLDRSTVYDKIRRGVVPSHRFDGRLYVSRGELDGSIAAAPSGRVA